MTDPAFTPMWKDSSVSVSMQTIQHAVQTLLLERRPVCVHASLRSFGVVEGGALTVVEAFLAEGCTVIVPSFTWSYAVPPPAHLRLLQNGWDYAFLRPAAPQHDRVYSSATAEIDKDMGAIPEAVVAHPQHQRGNHPICSFSAIGPLARQLVSGQQPLNVYAPLEELARLGGAVVLMGVGLNVVTLLHLAEKKAGRRLFRRWANDAAGMPMMVEAGGCSNGFEKFEPALRRLTQIMQVGRSMWRCLDAPEALKAAAKAISAEPLITHCGRADCERCNDAVKGGPLL
jgi:aminoglycoside 3-N-acetyltransferase